MKKLPHLILELANYHGGDPQKIKELIDQFTGLDYPDLGIKFQTFRYDALALEDYEWYDVYKELFIEEEIWAEILSLAKEKIGSVWLDVGDTYAVHILKENSINIRGFKLQASALQNHELLSALEKTDLTSKEVMINISGYNLDEIQGILGQLKIIGVQKPILQIGYQNFPAAIEDTPLGKIQALQEHFPEYFLSFADHLSGEEDAALRIPVYAALLGCSYIEKHVCLSRKEAKYDHYSSLEFSEKQNLVTLLKELSLCFPDEFIGTNERKYLEKSYQYPVAQRDIRAGELIAEQDLIYRRTDQKGLTWPEIQEIQSGRYILKNDIKKHQTIKREDYKKAKIGVIVACRMKSSRLKKKAVLPIRGMASVERCLERCLEFPYVDEVILATSTVEEDDVLGDYTLGGKVHFWKGDPDDVISRYLGACEKYGLDNVVRCTADCPAVSAEIAEISIQKHFEQGNDYTGPDRSHITPGSVCEVYNVTALKRVIELVGRADFSEYMNSYLQNNPQYFKCNVLNFSDDLVRNYRLALDYPEDLEFFELLYEELEKKNLKPTLRNIIGVLDECPDIVKINQHCTMIYKNDPALIERIKQKTTITQEMSNQGTSA